MCRFEFHNGLTVADGEETLLLAVVAAEGLFGRARTRLEFSYTVDGPGNAIEIDTGTEVGVTVIRIFTGLLLREHGEDAFEVRTDGMHPAASAEAKEAAA